MGLEATFLLEASSLAAVLQKGSGSDVPSQMSGYQL